MLEADTFVSIMSLLSEENEQHKWLDKKESRDIVETAAFGLLTQLCDGSLKGRKAVAASHNFDGCLKRALAILSDATAESKEEETFDEKDEDEKKDESAPAENDEDTKADAPAEAAPEPKSEEIVSTKIEVDNLSLIHI